MSNRSNRTGVSEKPRRKKQPVDLNTARKMLPLVRQIVTDIVNDSEQLARFTFEKDGLDRDKINLSWPERQRRYAVHGEVTRLQQRLEEQRRELDALGAVLTNRTLGQVSFPTTVNGRPAFFCWQLGEENVNYWHFDGESIRRPIPPNMQDSTGSRVISQR